VTICAEEYDAHVVASKLLVTMTHTHTRSISLHIGPTFVVKVTLYTPEHRSGATKFVLLAFLAPRQLKLNRNARPRAP